MTRFSIEPVRREDLSHVLFMIRELAEFEHLLEVVECTEEQLATALFGDNKSIEAMLGWVDDDGQREAVAYAIYFHNFSTFMGKRGLYLEDLYVRPAHRKEGFARAMLTRLAGLAIERGCARFEWTVLDWNTGAQDFYRGMGADVLPDWRITRLTGEALRKVAGAAPQS
jgi:GNAT superfamily N-acetyltransferase